MFARIIDKLINIFFRKNSNALFKIIIFLVIISPALWMSTRNYFELKKNLTNITLNNLESYSRFGSITLKERFNGLIDIGVSLASRVRFRELIKDGKWEDAIKILEQVPKDFPYIDRIFLVNPAGVLMSDLPSVPAVHGVDFSFRDWYKGVSKTKNPYISEIYRRTAEPSYNVVALSTPLKSLDGDLLGFLVLQIKLDTFFEWSKEFDVGPEGFLYFVDKNGNIAGHRQFLPQGDTVNFSDLSYIKKMLKGEMGSEVVYDTKKKQEKVVAFSPSISYDWGVVVEQPSNLAFSSRNLNINSHLISDFIILVILLILVFFILRFLTVLNDYRQKEAVFLDSIGDGLVAIDRNWNIILWNKSATMITGWSKEEAIGKRLRDVIKFVREKDMQEDVVFIEEAMLYKQVRFLERNTLLVKKDGSEVHVGDSAAPIFGFNGEVSGVILTFRDISAELESQKLRSDFVYASHQIRTPVSEAVWNLQALIGKKEVNAVCQSSLQVALNSMKSVQKLADQLSELSEIDQGMVIPKIEKVDPFEALKEVIVSFNKEADRRGIKFKITPTSPHFVVYTSTKLLGRILFEILDNAIAYGLKNTDIKIDISQQSNGILFEIHNFGKAISDEDQPIIFTKFFRGSNKEPKSIGAGLGLYICREYARLLNGKIWFRSREDEGTTFFILLPL